MSKQSAGILLYRRNSNLLEVLLAHPGGPFFSKKDEGVWSLPKGEYTDEDPFEAALREFQEEIGMPVPARGEYIKLQPITQSGGKVVQAWAVEGDLDVSLVKSNTFTMEWPPKSGKMQDFPEIDRAEWFSIEDGLRKIRQAQDSLLKELWQRNQPL